jgi:hypothetical protein
MTYLTSCMTGSSARAGVAASTLQLTADSTASAVVPLPMVVMRTSGRPLLRSDIGILFDGE